MRKAELAGKVQTVLGLVDAGLLGVTLPHEHLLTDLTVYFTEPTEATEKRMAYQPITLENLAWIRTHCLNHLDDLQLLDEELAIKEALYYKQAGGNTIVELSNIGLGRDPLGLARIARATGLNVIMGAGYYIGASHPPASVDKTENELAEDIIRDIIEGVENTGVRAGIIGEIGCSLPLEECERKVLRASAKAQRQTGAAVNIHPSRSDELVLEIVSILDEAGGDLSRTVISHVDAWGFSADTCRELLEAGCYLEFDTFGYEGIFPPLEGRVFDLPSDTGRINQIIQLIANGYVNQILIASDHCYKHLLVTYGGYGYAHILRNVVPVMRAQGVSDEQIHTILVENSRRMLQFSPAED